MALNGQVSKHAPHFMHLSLSIINGSLIFPEIAETGQTFEHFEHPLHREGSINIVFSF